MTDLTDMACSDVLMAPACAVRSSLSQRRTPDAITNHLSDSSLSSSHVHRT